MAFNKRIWWITLCLGMAYSPVSWALAGRDIITSCPVQACSDGVNSGVVTITCVQTTIDESASTQSGNEELSPGIR